MMMSWVTFGADLRQQVRSNYSFLGRPFDPAPELRAAAPTSCPDHHQGARLSADALCVCLLLSFTPSDPAPVCRILPKRLQLEKAKERPMDVQFE